jgi:hypothetical protein
VNTERDIQTGYTSYLLRLWPVQNAGRVVWRASLESTRTADQHRFATVEQLVTFLHQQTSAAASARLRFPPIDGQASRSGITWRFSLEDAQSGEQHEFATLEALIAFLNAAQ